MLLSPTPQIHVFVLEELQNSSVKEMNILWMHVMTLTSTALELASVFT